MNTDPKEQPSTQPEYPTSEAPLDDESQKGQTRDTYIVDSIPEGSMPYRQSHFSWVMSSALWIVAIVVIAYFDFMGGLLDGGILPVLFAVVIIGPRYLRWKQTVYHISSDSLYLTMGGLPIVQKPKIYRFFLKDIEDINLNYGFLGRTLGYAEVRLMFANERVGKLAYIEKYQDFVNDITSKTNLPKKRVDDVESNQPQDDNEES